VGAAQRGAAEGRAVQVDPIKPRLKLPGTKRLKLNCDGPLSNFAVKFKLRRCMKALLTAAAPFQRWMRGYHQLAAPLEEVLAGWVAAGPAGSQAGTYTRPLFSST